MVARARSLLAALAVSLGVVTSGIASADPLVVQLGSPNTALLPYPGPYGQVTYDLVDSNTATFTFVTLGSFLEFGKSLGVNINGAVTLISVTGNSPCLSPYSAVNPGNLSSFGTFNFGIDTFNGPSCGSTSITFVVDLVSGTWADTSAILVANSDGYFAAAHFGVNCNLASQNDCAVTGYAGGNETRVPPSEIPEPHTLALLALGLLGLGFARRKQR